MEVRNVRFSLNPTFISPAEISSSPIEDIWNDAARYSIGEYKRNRRRSWSDRIRALDAPVFEHARIAHERLGALRLAHGRM